MRPEGLQEEVGQGSGRLHGRVGHHIGDVYVLVVADGGNHRHGARGDGYGQAEVVEALEVQFAAAAAEDEGGVVVLIADFGEGLHDGCGGLFALHQGLVQIQLESIALRIIQEMVAEVLVAGGGAGRNHGQAVRQFRQGQFLLHIHVAVLLQALDVALAFQGLLAQGEGGVDVVYVQGHPVQLAESHLHAHQHRDAGLQFLPGGFLEVQGELRVVPLPDHGAGFGHGFSPLGLCEAQVAVSVGTGAPGRNLGLHPVPARKCACHAFLDPGLQFQKVHIIPLSHSPTNITKKSLHFKEF